MSKINCIKEIPSSEIKNINPSDVLYIALRDGSLILINDDWNKSFKKSSNVNNITPIHSYETKSPEKSPIISPSQSQSNFLGFHNKKIKNPIKLTNINMKYGSYNLYRESEYNKNNNFFEPRRKSTDSTTAFTFHNENIYNKINKIDDPSLVNRKYAISVDNNNKNNNIKFTMNGNSTINSTTSSFTRIINEQNKDQNKNKNNLLISLSNKKSDRDLESIENELTYSERNSNMNNNTISHNNTNDNKINNSIQNKCKNKSQSYGGRFKNCNQERKCEFFENKININRYISETDFPLKCPLCQQKGERIFSHTISVVKEDIYNNHKYYQSVGVSAPKSNVHSLYKISSIE